MKKLHFTNNNFEIEHFINKINENGFNQILHLPLQDRWICIHFLTQNTIPHYQTKITNLVSKLEELNIRMKEIENVRISTMMAQLDIVAMTTTGACKYREQLNKVGSEIILIEEAAEVLEAQIITSLNRKTKQLILIGDHMQLKPKVNSFLLSEKYGLSISLFERLVVKGVPNVQLNMQRRMRPEISELVKIIYPNLQDHPSVKEYEDIR